MGAMDDNRIISADAVLVNEPDERTHEIEAKVLVTIHLLV